MNKFLKRQISVSKVGLGTIQTSVPKRHRTDWSFYGQEENTYFQYIFAKFKTKHIAKQSKIIFKKNVEKEIQE